MTTSTIEKDVERSSLANLWYWAAGIGFLALAKTAYHVRGYCPKPFESQSIDACIDYDIATAKNLLRHLEAYGGSVKDAHVLELGPGSDLGVGDYLLYRGASEYTAVDRHNLSRWTTPRFNMRMRQRLEKETGGTMPDDEVRKRLVVTTRFELGGIAPSSVDVVVSNAAFEHFDNVERVARELWHVCRPGARLVSVVDLQTHSRWIRDRDPNNIYRYSEGLYRMFYFPGQPNRVRPMEYRKHFADAGWCDVTLLTTGKHDYAGRPVHSKFKSCPMLDTTSFVLCATRGGKQ